MNNADLAEIRALLQASAPPERRPRGPLLGAIRSLLPTPAPEPRASIPPPRRVGLRSAEPADIEAVEDLLLSEPLDQDGSAAAVEARRRAFGQRHGPAHDPVPILRLAAPLPPQVDADDAEVGELLRRRSLRLAQLTAPHVDETPYHPEDMYDGGDAEQIYADSGLFEPPPAAPEVQAEGRGARQPEDDPQRLLLRHLERVFIAELAALSALPRKD
jgi:hypothetical protein